MFLNKNLNELKKQLEMKKKAIEKEIKSLTKPKEFGSSDSESEEMDETEEFGTQLGIREVLKKRLSYIDSTLVKIEQNKYGLCEKCGSKISSSLLKIDPTSKFCQTCKKKLRKK